MSVYIILFALLVFFAIIESSLNYKDRRRAFIVTGLVLVFVVGFRTCGIDYFIYKSIYNRQLFLRGPWVANKENGAGILYLTIGYIFRNYNALVALVSCISVFCFYFAIQNECKKPSYAALFMFVLYFFMSFMMQSRQSCAISLVLVSILFVKRNYYISIALILLAVGFHQTAILALLIFAVPQKMFNLKYYVIIYLLCVLYRGIIEQFFAFNMLDIDYLSNKYNAYVLRQEEKEQFVSILSINDILNFILFYVVYNINRLNEYRKISYWLNLFFVSLCFRHIFSFIYELSVRGSQYFGVSQLLLIIVVINYAFSNKRAAVEPLSRNYYKLYLVSYLIILTYFTFGRTIKENINMGLIPYTNYFFDI